MGRVCDELFFLLLYSGKEIKNPCLTKRRARIIYSVCASPDLEDGSGERGREGDGEGERDRREGA